MLFPLAGRLVSAKNTERQIFKGKYRKTKYQNDISNDNFFLKDNVAKENIRFMAAMLPLAAKMLV